MRFSSTSSRKDRCLENPEANVKSDPDHHDAQPERDAPTPGQELVARNRAEDQHDEVRQEQAGGTAPLRPGGDEAAMGVGLGPFHRDQGGATPFAADAHALQKAHDGQDYRAPDADRGIARHKADGECRQAGQQQGRDQGHLAPDPVPIMPEQRGADRTRDKADGVDAEGLQGSDQRIGGRKKQMREDERGDLDVKQEIVSLDDRADGAGDDRAAQLPAVLGLGKRTRRDPGCCHRIPPRLPVFLSRASRRQDIFFKSANLTAWEQRRKSPTAEMAHGRLAPAIGRR